MADAQVIKPEDILKIMMDLYKLDPEATHNLFETRVVCDKKVEEHPTIIPYAESDNDPKISIGILGILNGILGMVGHRLYAQLVEDDHGCMKVAGFELKQVHTVK